MISIVIPFYLKLPLFRVTLPYNRPFFAQKNREVVLVIDDNTEAQDIINYIQNYKDIRWRVLVNQNKHLGWRNPSPVLNAGIHQSNGDLIFILSPESLMKNDVIGQLSDVVIRYNDFAAGFVNFCNLKEGNTWEENGKWLPYGSFCVSKDNLKKIGYYNEGFQGHGGDDDFVRSKLQKQLNLKGYYLPSAKIYHLERGVRPEKQTSEYNLTLLKNLDNVNLENKEKFEIAYDTIL